MSNSLIAAALFLVTGCGATAGSGSASNDAWHDSAGAVASADAMETFAAETAVPSETQAADAQSVDVDRVPPDTAPPEPCAQVVGKVMCNLESQGYIRDDASGLATEAPFSPSFVLAEVMAKSAQKYAVVMLGAWWCGKCRAATGLVVSKLAQYGKKATFVNLLVEGDTPSKPATKSNLQTWASQLKVPFTIGCDLGDTPFALKKELGPRETAYIIERATMKVIYKGPNVASALKQLDGLPE